MLSAFCRDRVIIKNKTSRRKDLIRHLRTHSRTFVDRLRIYCHADAWRPDKSNSQELFSQMFSRSLFIVALATIAGCAAQEPPVVEQAPQQVIVEPVVDEVVPEVKEDPVPGACEILLSRLEETEPLLASLDESLNEQAERIEQAVARINRPVPQPKIQECPTVNVGVLGKKEIIGAIEWLYMNPPGRHYRARVDSGAETSSLTANDLVEFERDGDEWVRFTFDHDGTDEAVNFELPIKRTVLIRQASSAEADRRVVVELDIRLGDQLQTTEFTLTDRSRMTYPILLGRAFLMDLYVVDVSRSYTHERYTVQ